MLVRWEHADIRYAYAHIRYAHATRNVSGTVWERYEHGARTLVPPNLIHTQGKLCVCGLLSYAQRTQNQYANIWPGLKKQRYQISEIDVTRTLDPCSERQRLIHYKHNLYQTTIILSMFLKLYVLKPDPTNIKVACTSSPIFGKNYEALPNIFCTNNLLSRLIKCINKTYNWFIFISNSFKMELSYFLHMVEFKGF